MTRRAARPVPPIVAAALVLLALAGCHPDAPTASSSTSSRPSASPTSVPISPSAAPATPAAVTPVDAARYLLEGTPGTPDATGTWFGHYGFWLDASHAIACDLFIEQTDVGGASCAIQPGHEAQRAYALPSGTPTTCGFDPSNSFQLDGTAVRINTQIFGPDATVGFAGCLGDPVDLDAAADAKRTVLAPGSRLDVVIPGDTAPEWSCTNDAGVASCAGEHGAFRFSLSTASFQQAS
jgi:hypothetical protein